MYKNELLPANLVTYGCKITKSEPRYAEYKSQRLERGFDDSETWSLYTSISKFLVPRLKRFKELTTAVPVDIDEIHGVEKGLVVWKDIIETMIQAFEIMAADDDFMPDDAKMCIFDEGLENFKTYFSDLWW